MSDLRKHWIMWWPDIDLDVEKDVEIITGGQTILFLSLFIGLWGTFLYQSSDIIQ